MLDMFASQDDDHHKASQQRMAPLRRPKRADPAIWRLTRSTRVALCLLLVAGVLSLALAVEKDDQEQQDERQSQEQQQLGRQYFKVNVVPGRKPTGFSSKKLAAKMAAKSSAKTVQIKQHSDSGGSESAQTSSSAAAAAAGTANTDELSIRAKKGQQEEAASGGSGQKAAGVKQRPPTTISSTTLKKLLNQTLSKSSAANNSSSQAQTQTNGGAGAGPKTSNFKFVFIQRATAAPHRSISPKSNSSISNSNNTKGNSQPSRTTLNAGDRQQPAVGKGGLDSVRPAPSPSSSPKASLAASVSKQLASTLLNSAAGLVADLSSVPSLSSLASQFVAASLDNNDNSKQPGSLNYIGDPPLGLRRNSTSVSGGGGGFSTESSADDSKQRQQSSDDFEITKKTAPSSGATKKATKSRPSKIYNLPVKFVANGQPNHVVFHTLKEHFATIKRLQAMGTKSQAHSQRQQQQQQAGEHSGKQRKKQHQQRHRLKGTNSRLIYLPLRYLSNAKPNKAGSIKATSKAAAAQKP